MIIKKKLGTLSEYKLQDRLLDCVQLEWYETCKRILHKRTAEGRDIVLKSLNEAPQWMQGDVLYEDSKAVVIISIVPCQVIAVTPKNLLAMAAACYEIGNKHLPLFYQGENLLIPYEAPLFRWLEAAGFDPRIQMGQLLHRLKTTVAPHDGHAAGGSLFSKILQLTSPAND